jgi:hypothetical protein
VRKNQDRVKYPNPKKIKPHDPALVPGARVLYQNKPLKICFWACVTLLPHQSGEHWYVEVVGAGAQFAFYHNVCCDFISVVQAPKEWASEKLGVA